MHFGYPSVKKIMFAGVLIENGWEQRQPEDSPKMTFCALNNKTVNGLRIIKTGDFFIYGWISAFDLYCNNTNTMQAAEDCLERNMFNPTDTIKNITI